MGEKSFSLTKSLKKTIRGFDIYGSPIQLTYKKETTFKSLLGGVVTLLTRLGILAYLFLQI